MSNSLSNSKFHRDFAEILRQIQQTRRKVFTQANTALIGLYWNVGKIVTEKVQQEDWGKNVVQALARYISQTDPDIKGFSDKNLWRMKQFYETYRDDEKLSMLVRELPWSHNLAIFSRCKSSEEREFYLNLSVQEKYSVRQLDRQISAGFFERTVLGNPKLSTALRELHPSINQTFKDQYVLEFLGLPESHSESDLQKALVRHMKAFILELGRDFLFVGEEFRTGTTGKGQKFGGSSMSGKRIAMMHNHQHFPGVRKMVELGSTARHYYEL